MIFIKTLDKLKNLAGTHSLALTLIEDNVFILPCKRITNSRKQKCFALHTITTTTDKYLKHFLHKYQTKQITSNVLPYFDCSVICKCWWCIRSAPSNLFRTSSYTLLRFPYAVRSCLLCYCFVSFCWGADFLKCCERYRWELEFNAQHFSPTIITHSPIIQHIFDKPSASVDVIIKSNHLIYESAHNWVGNVSVTCLLILQL